MVMPSGSAAPSIGTARSAMPRLKEAVGRNHGLSPDTVHHGVSGGRRTPEMAAEREEERTVVWREKQHVEEGEMERGLTCGPHFGMSSM